MACQVLAPPWLYCQSLCSWSQSVFRPSVPLFYFTLLFYFVVLVLHMIQVFHNFSLHKYQLRDMGCWSLGWGQFGFCDIHFVSVIRTGDGRHGEIHMRAQETFRLGRFMKGLGYFCVLHSPSKFENWYEHLRWSFFCSFGEEKHFPVILSLLWISFEQEFFYWVQSINFLKLLDFHWV